MVSDTGTPKWAVGQNFAAWVTMVTATRGAVFRGFFPKSRHVESIGAGEHKATALLGVIEDELLGNSATLGIAQNCDRWNAKMVDQV